MRVSYLMIVQFIVVLISLNLMLVVMWRNSRDKMSRIFSLFVWCCVWWGSAILLRMAATSEAKAILSTQIGSFGWIPFSSFFVWFVLIFIKREDTTRKRWFYPLIFSVPALLLLAEWLTPFLITTGIESSGWNAVWTNSIWSYLYFFYYSSFLVWSIWLLLRYRRQTEIRLYKQQTLIIIVSVLVSATAGTVFSVILPLLGINSIMAQNSIYTLFWPLGMFYAVIKYKLFDPSFTLAGKNIIDNMSESLLLLDKDGRIVDANNRALKFLGVSREDIVNQDLVGYFSGKTLASVNKMLADKSDLEHTDTEIRLKDGSEAPVLFSCSGVRGADKSFLGWVCIVGDISRQKKDDAALAVKNAELQEKLAEVEKYQKVVIDRELKMIELKKKIDGLNDEIKRSGI